MTASPASPALIKPWATSRTYTTGTIFLPDPIKKPLPDSTRAINPCRADDYHGCAALFDQIGYQLLPGNFAATIGVILGMQRMILGNYPMQVMPINCNRTCMHNALHPGVHRRGYQVYRSPHISGSVNLLQPPRTPLRCDVIYPLHTLYCPLN